MESKMLLASKISPASHVLIFGAILVVGIFFIFYGFLRFFQEPKLFKNNFILCFNM